MVAPQLSVVSPVYRSPLSLEALCARVKSTAQRMGVSYEIILVDDRCPLGSWEIIHTLAANDPSVRGVRLSRNFGQHPAIYAGLRLARGHWIVVMDCDLQDVPEEIEKLYRAALTGYDAVRARRAERRDGLLRRLGSSGFYRTLSFLTGVKHSADIGNFGIYSRKIVDTLLSWHEDHRYFPAAVQWVGFSVLDLDVVHGSRPYGRSSYNFLRLLRLALSVIVSFSDRPLRLLAYGGLVVAVIAFFYAIYLVLAALVGGVAVPGWTSVIASVWLLSGVIVFSIGVTGFYVGQILREVKGHPNYLIDVTTDAWQEPETVDETNSSVGRS
jgi:glycosyltransferase involved in cell wall biosynthesis